MRKTKRNIARKAKGHQRTNQQSPTNHSASLLSDSRTAAPVSKSPAEPESSRESGIVKVARARSEAEGQARTPGPANRERSETMEQPPLTAATPSGHEEPVDRTFPETETLAVRKR